MEIQSRISTLFLSPLIIVERIFRKGLNRLLIVFLESRYRWNGQVKSVRNALKRFRLNYRQAGCAATRWQISTRRGRLPSRLPFANFTTVIWRSLGYLLLGMATPWPRGKLTNFTRERWQNKRRRRGKIRFYEREELPWTFIGFVKAVGIRLPWIFLHVPE